MTQLKQDELLLKRLKNGDRDAFEQIVESYRAKVFGTLVNLLGRYEEAEEAFWEVWGEFWRSLPRFKGESSLSTWIYSITTHVAYHQRRRRPKFTIDLEEARVTDESSTDIEAQVLQNEESRFIEKAIAKLPDNLRVPLSLQAIAELSYEEISEVLHVPIGALKTRVWRARVGLKKELEKWKNSMPL